MTAPYARSAAFALDEARPAIERLDISRDPEDLAADLIDAWEGAQRALRGLVGSSSLSGQALIREVRARDLLSLDQAHALVEFSGAAERAHRVDYRPSVADVDAARAGFSQLESAILHGVPERKKDRDKSVVPPSQDVWSEPAKDESIVITPPAPSGRQPWFFALLILLVIVGAIGAGGAYYWTVTLGPQRALEKGRAAYAAGDKTTARNVFSALAKEHPEMSTPHVYLGRMAREDGDVASAATELATAVRLDPNDELAQREMGAHLLASAIGQINAGNMPAAMQTLQLARNFYTRAVRLDPNDRNATGFLGCTLMRLGQIDVGMRFLQRAGQGSWSVCASLAQPRLQPGQTPGQIPR